MRSGFKNVFDGMRGSDCSIKKNGLEKALFRLRKNARFGLRSEIALFDPLIRLHKKWPKSRRFLSYFVCGTRA